MTVTQIWEIIGLLFGTSIVVQITPIKINPWSWILKQIGSLLNADITAKLDKVSDKVDALEQRVSSHDEIREEDRALEARRRILRFSDECVREIGHSKEYFDNILEDITLYEHYCEAHPKFLNEKCALSIETIKDDYRQRTDKKDFL